MESAAFEARNGAGFWQSRKGTNGIRGAEEIPVRSGRGKQSSPTGLRVTVAGRRQSRESCLQDWESRATFKTKAAGKKVPGCCFFLPTAGWRHRSKVNPQMQLCESCKSSVSAMDCV
jgi:hypothetical protein